jgi:hypothetical protein
MIHILKEHESTDVLKSHDTFSYIHISPKFLQVICIKYALHLKKLGNPKFQPHSN